MNSFTKIVIAALFTCLISCKKDTVTSTPQPAPINTPVTTGNLKFQFENLVDTLPLVFGQKYLNAKGDTFQVSKFNYYISNIVLTMNDNSTFAEENSYHIVRHSNSASSFITLGNVPYGSYKSVKFMLGVDSARNTSGAQTGDLDPANASDMYWSWSSGYIFMKLEGTSPKSTAGGKLIEFHIGGYGGLNKTQRNFNLSFGTYVANVSASIIPEVHLGVNLNELFKTPNLIDFSIQNVQTSAGSGAKIYADNYADMITFKHVHN